MSRAAVGAVVLAATAVAAVARGSSGPTQPTTYTLAGRQAQEVAVTLRFVNAFNAHNPEQALASLAPNAGISDCDYRHRRIVRVEGKREIAVWLGKRFADGDHLGVARVFNENAEQPTAGLGIEWSVRTSKTLRRLGFSRGIKPQLSAKVILTSGSPPRIRAFSNGPAGGDPRLCRPS